MTEYADVPAEILARLRPICLALPDTYEEPAWTGTRWMIRKRNFCHVLTPDGENGPITIMTFRASAEEGAVLAAVGHPFFRLGGNAVGMVLDDDTDWTEVEELLTESYCVLAPKKLVESVGRPELSDEM